MSAEGESWSHHSQYDFDALPTHSSMSASWQAESSHSISCVLHHVSHCTSACHPPVIRSSIPASWQVESSQATAWCTTAIYPSLIASWQVESSQSIYQQSILSPSTPSSHHKDEDSLCTCEWSKTCTACWSDNIELEEYDQFDQRHEDNNTRTDHKVHNTQHGD